MIGLIPDSSYSECTRIYFTRHRNLTLYSGIVGRWEFWCAVGWWWCQRIVTGVLETFWVIIIPPIDRTQIRRNRLFGKNSLFLHCPANRFVNHLHLLIRCRGTLSCRAELYTQYLRWFVGGWRDGKANKYCVNKYKSIKEPLRYIHRGRRILKGLLNSSYHWNWNKSSLTEIHCRVWKIPATSRRRRRRSWIHRLWKTSVYGYNWVI